MCLMIWKALFEIRKYRVGVDPSKAQNGLTRRRIRVSFQRRNEHKRLALGYHQVTEFMCFRRLIVPLFMMA